MEHPITEKAVQELIHIKNCPFCGCEPNISFISYAGNEDRHWMEKKGCWSNGWVVDCKKMGCIFRRPNPYATIDDLIKDWNERKEEF